MGRLKERLRKIFGNGKKQTGNQSPQHPVKDTQSRVPVPPPKVEYSGRSYLKKDGSAYLEAVFEPGAVTTFFLEIAKHRFAPLEWQPLDLKQRQRRSYLFDLNRILESIDEQELKHAAFVAINPAGEYRSALFDISGLIM